MKNINTVIVFLFFCLTIQSHILCAQGGCNLALSFSKHHNVLCNGDSTGSATISVNGGKTPYTYIWSPYGGTKSSVLNLNAQKFIVTVTDSNGCTAKDSITITQPPPLKDSLMIYKGIGCYGQCTGYLKFEGFGGAGTISITWPDAYACLDSICARGNLCPGLYKTVATDSNGCQAFDIVMLTTAPPLNLSFDTTLATNGCNGTAIAKVTGGTYPYGYNWETVSSVSDSIGGLCAGSYCCVIKDSNGCRDSGCVTISVPTGMATVDQNTPQTYIYPNPNDGSFTVSLIGQYIKPQIEIFNVLGEMIYMAELSQNSTNVEIASIHGIYIYRVLDNNSPISIGKIILE